MIRKIKKFKTSKARLKYMREYYQTEKYKAWQRAYRKKRYHTDKKYREYVKKKNIISRRKKTYK